MSQQGRRTLAALAALIAMYFMAGRLGLSLALVNASASAVWPPTGLAIGCLLLFGNRVWPAIAAGAFLVNLSTTGVVSSSLAITAGNTLEALAGAWLARRFARGPAAFDHTADILVFVVVTIVGATTIAATVGSMALVLTGLASPRDIGSVWFTWWFGDAVGAMVVTPLVIFWLRPSDVGWTRRAVIEACGLTAILVVASVIVFGALPAGTLAYPLEVLSSYPLVFVLVPILLWPAFRFGRRETVTAAAAAATIAIVGTLRGRGPFATGSANESLLLLQAYIGVTTMVMMSVAAEVNRRRATEAETRALTDDLERRVVERTEELVRMTDRLVEAQQVAQVGSWEWDVASNSLWWSIGLCRLYGLQAGDVTSYEEFLTHVHSDDRELVQRIVGQAMVDRRAFTFEHRIVRSDGEVRLMYGAGRVETGPDGAPVRMMGIGMDITERTRAEDERAQLIREQAARHEAEQMNRAKDEFLAVLSHELRTPLNAALGWAHMFRELPPDDPRTRRALDAIYRNLFVQARLVSDIMDVSRIARGSLLLDKAPIDLPAVIDAAIELVREPAALRGIVIETDAGEPCAVVADAKRLQQVLWNLLSNAVKFGREGGRVRVGVRVEAGVVSIAVDDDGPGIAPEFLPHVFDQFRQADASSTRRHEGLGLGLAIARHIVEQHGGSIVASNLAGGGASFVIRLPAEAAVSLSETAPAGEFSA